jgi:hypothetical protein
MQYPIVRTARLPLPDADWDRPDWQPAATLEVALYPWKDSGHRPRTQARLCCDDQALAVIFRVEDRYVRAVAGAFQDSVCTDSCVEFFVSPLPDSDAYFNFEVNCGGTMLLYSCPGAAERQAGRPHTPVTAADGATIQMAHSLPAIVKPEIGEPTTWTVEYHVPFALFGKYLGAGRPGPGTVWKGNFYKCGDHTSHPHWGSWAPVDSPQPNFHLPEFFQPLVFA